VCVLPVDSAAFAVWVTDFDYIPPPWLWFRLFISGDRRINVQRNYRAKETTEWLVHIHTHSLTLARHSWKRSSTLRQQVPSPPSLPLPALQHTEKKDTCCDARCLIFYATLYRLAERGSLIKACALICLLLWCSAVFVSEGARGHIGTLASLVRTHSRIKLAEKEWFLAGEFSLACLRWMRSIKYRISPAFFCLWLWLQSLV